MSRRPERSGSIAIGEVETGLRRAILAGYPDRVAQRRAPGSDPCEALVRRWRDDGARQRRPRRRVSRRASTFRVTNHRKGGELARIRVASRIEPEWLAPNATEVVHRLDEATGTVRAFEVDRYDALILTETVVPPDREVAASLLAAAWTPTEDDERLLRRARFAGRPLDVDAPCAKRRSVPGPLRTCVSRDRSPPQVRHALDRDAPETLAVPSGRAVRLDYLEDGTVRADVKLQELFGLGETPRLGPRHEPVLLALLAPNGRPVQLTRDLKSFWARTYPEVRKELRGRYPKHPWPEDPWTARPTADEQVGKVGGRAGQVGPRAYEQC